MNRIPRFTRLVAALGLGLSLATTLLASRPAQAEGEIRIAEQFGIVYLLLNVVRDQRLIEKHGQAEGLQIKVDWTQLSGGAAVNDALLSGAIDIAGAGVGPLLTIWDRTRGRQNVKAVASLGNFPYYLLSNDPRVRSIADFGAGIASPCRRWGFRCSRASSSTPRRSSGATSSSTASTSTPWRCRIRTPPPRWWPAAPS